MSLTVECRWHAGGWRHRLQRAHAERLQRHGYALFLTAGLLTRGRDAYVQRECAESIKSIFTQALLSAAAYCTMARTGGAERCLQLRESRAEVVVQESRV